MSIRRVVAASSVALVSILSATAAQAYDSVVVFGDSLSDNGNLAAKFGGAVPAAPYFNGRFSNGLVSVEVMAQQLGLPLKDYAYGGALTGLDNQFQTQNPAVANTGMLAQVNKYLQNNAADAHALYVVSGGGNDFLAAISSGNLSNPAAIIGTAVTNLVTEVGLLYGAGARDFLVPLLPDLGTTYYGTSGALPAASLSQLSTAFNSTLSAQLNNIKAAHADLNLTVFDTPGFTAGLRADMAANGANLTGKCWTGNYAGTGQTAPVCSNPDQYYLWDNVHPSAYVHNAVGVAMAAAVPEPATSALMLVGLLVSGVALRRQGRV